jgi:3-hydroxybutyryl-CoA dehydrogenase
MTKLGVVGGGTMGSGIAQVAAQQGMDVLLWDVRQDLLEGALARIRGFVQRGVERGRMAQAEADAVMARIATTTEFEQFSDVDCVIEAVLEDIETKSGVFRSLDTHCPPQAVLATNTSSLSVTEIAAATRRPESVVGLHFFNPVPLMALVEVVRGSATSDETMERAVAIAHELGKTPVRAEDTPGFIVNRVVRPFYNEALRILNDGVASFQDIDRAMRGVGFRMGPFELMDLIGNDVNFAVTSSIYAQCYGDPKYRPSFRQQRMVQGGFLGQKTKRGWYDYGSERPADAESPPASGLNPLESVLVLVDSPGNDELVDALAAAGVKTSVQRVDATGATALHAAPSGVGAPEAILDLVAGRRDLKRGAVTTIERLLPAEVPILSLALTAGTTEIASWCQAPGRVCGFGYLPPLADSSVLEIAPGLQTGEPARRVAERLAVTLGKESVFLKADASGLIAPRIVSLIANEAAFALMEEVASAADIDAAVRLGANYPHGPLEWAEAIGVDLVCSIIGAMFRELGEDRYRIAPLLRRMALARQTERDATSFPSDDV